MRMLGGYASPEARSGPVHRCVKEHRGAGNDHRCGGVCAFTSSGRLIKALFQVLKHGCLDLIGRLSVCRRHVGKRLARSKVCEQCGDGSSRRRGEVGNELFPTPAGPARWRGWWPCRTFPAFRSSNALLRQGDIEAPSHVCLHRVGIGLGEAPARNRSEETCRDCLTHPRDQERGRPPRP